jgi:hypothetical protein
LAQSSAKHLLPTKRVLDQAYFDLQQRRCAVMALLERKYEPS